MATLAHAQTKSWLNPSESAADEGGDDVAERRKAGLRRSKLLANHFTLLKASWRRGVVTRRRQMSHGYVVSKISVEDLSRVGGATVEGAGS